MLVTTIDTQWEGMGNVGSTRYEVNHSGGHVKPLSLAHSHVLVECYSVRKGEEKE